MKQFFTILKFELDNYFKSKSYVISTILIAVLAAGIMFVPRVKDAITGDKKDLYNEDLYKYIKCPKIISFIKMVKDKDINLSNYLDINELIKGIYRSVEGK